MIWGSDGIGSPGASDCGETAGACAAAGTAAHSSTAARNRNGVVRGLMGLLQGVSATIARFLPVFVDRQRFGRTGCVEDTENQDGGADHDSGAIGQRHGSHGALAV